MKQSVTGTGGSFWAVNATQTEGWSFRLQLQALILPAGAQLWPTSLLSPTFHPQLPGRVQSRFLAPSQVWLCSLSLENLCSPSSRAGSEIRVTCGSPAPSFLNETPPDLLSEAHGFVLGHKERRQIMDSHGGTKLTRDSPGRAVKIPHP